MSISSLNTLQGYFLLTLSWHVPEDSIDSRSASKRCVIIPYSKQAPSLAFAKHGIISHWTFQSCRASEFYRVSCPIQATTNCRCSRYL